MNKNTYIIITLIFSTIIVSTILAKKPPIKLYTFYTPSHIQLKDHWFLPTLQDDYKVIVKKFSQKCPTGLFLQKGWKQTMHHKINLILEAIQENWGSYFIYADIDIQFFGKTQPIIEKYIASNDMLFQKDDPHGNICAGFVVCCANKKTLHFWQHIKKLLPSSPYGDQWCVNQLLQKDSVITWDYLPDSFFGGGTLTGEDFFGGPGKRWEPGCYLPIPENIVMHHANWTVGTPNKIAQLAYVRAVVANQANTAYYSTVTFSS